MNVAHQATTELETLWNGSSNKNYVYIEYVVFT